MAFSPISQANIAAAKAIIQNLWQKVKDNFDDHQSRINTLEGTSVVIPTGGVIEYGGTAAPSGFLLCDGTAVSRTTFSDLFAILGTVYGVGDGATTFNVPDKRGKVGIGAGEDSGKGLTDRTLGGFLGEEDHSITEDEMAAHDHDFSDPSHSHQYNINDGVFGVEPTRQLDSLTTIGGVITISNSVVTAFTGIVHNSQGLGDGHNNIQPSLGFNYIIKT